MHFNRAIPAALALTLAGIAGLALAEDEGAAPKPAEPKPVRKQVLVELFTSQG
jgi:hypothetical protein